MPIYAEYACKQAVPGNLAPKSSSRHSPGNHGGLGSERVVGLAESYNCRLLLERAPATPSAGLLGARELIDLAGGDKRIGVCFDSCHMFATGFDIRTADKVSEVVDRFAGTVRIRRLKSLHVSYSMIPLGSNRDRHAIPARARSELAGAAHSCRSRASRGCRPSSRARARAATPPTRWSGRMKELRRNGLRARNRRRR